MRRICRRSGAPTVTARSAGAALADSSASPCAPGRRSGSLSGAPASYRSSGFARRGFCAACGSGLTFTYDGNPDTWVTLGSLDQPRALAETPDVDLGAVAPRQIDRRVAWHLRPTALPQAIGAALAALQAAAQATNGR